MRLKTFQPMRDNVLVDPIFIEKVGSIELPKNSYEGTVTQKGTVVKLGPKVNPDHGLKVGDIVVHSLGNFTPIELDGKEYRLVPEDQLFCVLAHA